MISVRELRIWIAFNADPDPAFHFNADPDPNRAPQSGKSATTILDLPELRFEPLLPHCERPGLHLSL